MFALLAISENLRTSLFNDELSDEPNFSQMHFAGQYIYRHISIFLTLEQYCSYGSKVISCPAGMMYYK